MGKEYFAGAAFYVNHKVQFFEIRQNLLFDWDLYKTENKLLDCNTSYPGYFGLNIFSVKATSGNLLRAAETRPDVNASYLVANGSDN